jgi:O-antigen ligase
LILGGSAQGIWQNALLQLVGIGIICWAAIAMSYEPLPRAAKPLFWFAIAAIIVVVLQQIPLPPGLAPHGIRGRILQDYRLLGSPSPAIPVSLTPYGSLSTLLCLIPPFALFCAIVRLNAYRRSWLTIALLTGTILGILLGALQVVTVGGVSPWYLYPETNRGVGVGFFANANHMANLLVMALPFLAAFGLAAKGASIQRYSASLFILGAVGILLLVGIALNGSLAGYALAVPVIAASLLMVLSRKNRARRWLAAAVALAVVAAVGALATSSIGATVLTKDASTSLQSREQILRTTGQAIADFMPWGSGLGSFLKVYRLYESPDTITSEYVVHAHNDYAELTLELGAAGIALMLLFLAWWLRAVWDAWIRASGDPFTRAASIASAAVLLHSLVDFPLRTAAISACFSMCLALLADRRAPPRQDAADLRPARHVVIG